jgi:hypothetical protein
MLFAMLKTVLERFWGGAVAERYTQQRAGEVPDFLSSKVLPGENLQLGKEGNRDTHQEEAANYDDAVIPYHLWDSRLIRLWAGDELINPHNYGIPQAAGVVTTLLSKILKNEIEEKFISVV